MSKRDSLVPGCYAELFTHYFQDPKGWVAGVIRRFFPRLDSDDLDDILAECWGRMHRQELLEKFDPSKGNFGGLVFQSVRSECLTRMTKLKRTPTNMALVIDESDEGSHNALGMTWGMGKDQRVPRTGAIVRHAMEAKDFMAQLLERQSDPRKRRALELFLELRDGGQIAEEIQMSRATVSAWKREFTTDLEELGWAPEAA